MDGLLDAATLDAEIAAAADVGMIASVWARLKRDAPAIHDPDGRVRTFGEVNANANRIVRLLRAAGLRAGDSVAVACSNRAEFVEVFTATGRAGFRFTPINWHLTAEEIGYIVADCEAKAFFAEARVTAAAQGAASCPALRLRIAIGGELPEFTPYDTALGPFDGGDIADPSPGMPMMYTSGTTGRPKGVLRGAPIVTPPLQYFRERGYDAGSVQMCAGPSYHAAPLAFDVRAAMVTGTPLHFLDKWDSERTLRTIHERRVTHMHLVPIMFQRLLALPQETRAKYDVSSLRFVLHGAAPCPPEVKRAAIDWLGPVITEYYGGSEGGGIFTITSQEWLQRPGSVGKIQPGLIEATILGEDGQPVPRGVAGGIYQPVPAGGFSYFKDQTKTLAARVGDLFTMGDMGYLDEDDYLFLTGRNAETIISGGVNIYPQEIDNELIKHPAVADSATVGVPDAEWGEAVRAVILLKPGHAPSPALAEEILAFAKAGLPGFKVPRALDFVADLPRTEAGKVQRGKVRAPYWAGREKQI